MSDTGTLAYVPRAGAGTRAVCASSCIDRSRKESAAQPLEASTRQHTSHLGSLENGSQIAYVIDDRAPRPTSGSTTCRAPNSDAPAHVSKERIAFPSGQTTGSVSHISRIAKATWAFSGSALMAVISLWTPQARAEARGGPYPRNPGPRGDSIFRSAWSRASNVSLSVFSVQHKTATPVDGVRSQYPLNSTFSPDGRWLASRLARQPRLWPLG